MAALAIVGAMMSSCAEEIEVAQPANTDKTVMVKTTVSLDENATTRALTSNGEKTFAVGEQIAVIYENTSNQTVKAVSEALAPGDIDTDNTHKATFSVPLTNPKPSGNVRYVYPASRAAATIATDAAVDGNATINYAALATQDGTFASLANDLDLATTFDGTLTESGTLPATASLVNPLTIGKFTIKNSGGTDITSSITGLNISDGTNTYAVTREAADGPIYVAMQPITSTQTVAVNVTDGTNHYTKTVTEDYALVASNIYDIAVTINSTPGANLSAVTADYIAKNGEVLTGTLGSNVKISIADGATVTLNGVTINGNGDNEDDDNYQWAGITCKGDATINIEGTNIVKRFYRDYPAIQAGPAGKTLIIGGTGSLTATGGRYGSGIGSSYDSTCGDITINSGTITASSLENGAGIGTGSCGTCGNITINGGNITASSRSTGCAGIGSGEYGKFGNITIYAGITQVQAKCRSNEYWPAWPIGKGYQDKGSGTVTIDNCSVTSKDWDGTGMTQLNFTATNDGNLYTWTLNRYPMSVATATLSSVDIGKVLTSDGYIYASKAAAEAADKTAVAIIAYLGSAGSVDQSSSTYKGLAIALNDVDGVIKEWSTIDVACVSFSSYVATAIGYKNGIACTNTLTTNSSGTCSGHTHAAASACRSNMPAAPTTYTSDWFLPSLGQWQLICQGLASKKAGSPVTTAVTSDTNDTYKSSNLNSIIADAGGIQLAGNRYWSSTEYDTGNAWAMDFNEGSATNFGKKWTLIVRAALAF